VDISPYLKLMVERGASDLFFTADAPIHIKIEGVTSPVGKNSLTAGTIKSILPSLLSKQQLTSFERDRELDTAFTLKDVGRFRINVYMQRGEEAMVIRQIKWQTQSIEELGLPVILNELVMESRGLIIIAGATGTGKSSTVAAMLDYRNTHKTGHILTIEDPIEFLHPHKKSLVSQREVGLDTESFSEALRRAMREAPDVIMIGEIRDEETMKQALAYADTGHLCLATLHATNTSQAVERMMSFFPDSSRSQLLMELSLNLRAVVAQRLMRVSRGARIPATEILLNEPLVKAIIREGETHKLKDVLEKVMEGSRMHSFDNEIIRLFRAKKVSFEEAIENADEPDHMKLKIKLGGHGISSDASDIYSV
jgi:twitching motility protein PilU